MKDNEKLEQCANFVSESSNLASSVDELLDGKDILQAMASVCLVMNNGIPNAVGYTISSGSGQANLKLCNSLVKVAQGIGEILSLIPVVEFGVDLSDLEEVKDKINKIKENMSEEDMQSLCDQLFNGENDSD